MTSLVIGYARVSRFGGDADEQQAALLTLGAAADRVYLDMDLTGMTRPRPCLREALAAARGGDTLVVTALARLARSVPDASQLLNGLIAGGVTRSIAGRLYPPRKLPHMFFSRCWRWPRICRPDSAAAVPERA